MRNYNCIYRILDLINVRDRDLNSNNNNQNQNQSNRDIFYTARWVFNTIVDRVAPERCFVHGNLEPARAFVHGLQVHQNQLHQADAVYTLPEGAGLKIMRVVERGGAVSVTAFSISAPILDIDSNIRRNYFQNRYVYIVIYFF